MHALGPRSAPVLTKVRDARDGDCQPEPALSCRAPVTLAVDGVPTNLATPAMEQRAIVAVFAAVAS